MRTSFVTDPFYRRTPETGIERFNVMSVVVTRVLIDDRTRRRKDKACSCSGNCCNARRCGNNVIAEAEPLVSKRLSIGKAGTDQLHDLRRLGKLAMMELVTGFDFGQVNNGYLVGGKFRLI